MATGRWMLDTFGRIQIEPHWVQVAGHRMHSLKAGTGPELILLHGLLGTASTWEPTIPNLAQESTIYAVDALGIGDSERVPGLDATLEAQAGRMIEFMDRSGIGCADFLATSHGGAVALTLAAKYPDRVKNLLLHAPANPYSRLADPLDQFLSVRTGDLVCAPHPHPARIHAIAGPRPHVRRPHAFAERFPGKVHRLPARAGNGRLRSQHAENLVGRYGKVGVCPAACPSISGAFAVG